MMNKSKTVYDLSIEGCHEFFANGFLVHNSNLCLSLDGRVAKNKDELPQPPVHFNCRSRLVSILLDQVEKPKVSPKMPKEVKDSLGTGFWDAKNLKTPKPLVE